MRELKAAGAETVARHAFGWLVAANAVGVVLASLLVWPAMGDWLGPLTYGRWMPLHMDWQLYGWCSLPLVGALFAWMLRADDARAERQARWAVRAWSAALVLGGVSWLGGIASGKLFLDWSGWARPLLPSAMIVLWVVLASQVWSARATMRRARWFARAAVLVVLAMVPFALFFATGRDVYPSVNPDSGGATGASLLGSTLGIIALGGVLPQLLGVERCADRGVGVQKGFWAMFAVSAAVYAVVDHGHASHHSREQIVALATLLAWVPLMVVYFRAFEWPTAARPWLYAAAVWWALLVATGWLTFLPEISESLKFTHALVAHAHLALAGLVTSVGVAILIVPGRGASAGAGAFWVWQVACGVHVLALMVLGTFESSHAMDFFLGAPWITGLLAVRLVTGVAMLGASIVWWRRGVA